MPTLIFEPPIAPENNPFFDPNFFDLNFDPALPDDVELSAGLLTLYPQGLRALDGNDTVVGSSDGEIVNGNAGQDKLFGRIGADYFRGGRDNDELFGESDDDILNGNLGDDFVDGGTGNDLVRGGQGQDLLIGGLGTDTLIGDFGQDALIGGADSDLFVLRTDTSVNDEVLVDILIDFSGTEDNIGLTGGISEADLTLTSISRSIDELPDAINTVFNFFNQGIISFEEFREQFLNGGPQRGSIIQILNISGISENLVQSLLEANISPSSIDPNGDLIVEGTLIGVNGGNDLLGFVLNATPTDISGKFVEVSDSLLAMG